MEEIVQQVLMSVLSRRGQLPELVLSMHYSRLDSFIKTHCDEMPYELSTRLLELRDEMGYQLDRHRITTDKMRVLCW